VRHPVSLALYAVMFEPDPAVHAGRVAAMFRRRDWSPDKLAAMTREIALELEQPTQQVRDILDCAATEEKCRQFLAAFVASMR
jgi:hypothetical protein